MYALFIPILLYGTAVYYSSKYSWRPIASSLLVVLGTTAVNQTIRAISVAPNGSFNGFITVKEVLTIGVQLIVAYVIFRILDQYEETYFAWFGVAFMGFIGIFALAPYLVSLFPI